VAIETVHVGQAAKRSGLTEKAIRLYESKGLLATAGRSEAGYRRFTDEDVAVLCFIRQAKTLGLRLGEIKDIIDLQREGAQPCGKVIKLVDEHIREIDSTLADLKALRRSLVGVRQAAEESSRQGDAAVVCRIIESAAG